MLALGVGAALALTASYLLYSKPAPPEEPFEGPKQRKKVVTMDYCCAPVRKDSQSGSLSDIK